MTTVREKAKDVAAFGGTISMPMSIDDFKDRSTEVAEAYLALEPVVEELVEALKKAEHRYRSMWFDIRGPKPVSNSRGEWECIKAALSKAQALLGKDQAP
jgi:hypothetical protein